MSSCGEDTNAIRKCLVAGYFANAAQLASDGRYCTVKGKVVVVVHPSSIVAKYGSPPEWVIYNEVVHNKETQIREVTRIEPRWLLEYAPHYYSLAGVAR